MKRKGAEGLAAVYRKSPAANEEFTAMVKALDRLARPQSGWDPYEVWRTRVKGLCAVTPARAGVGARLLGVTQTAHRLIRGALETGRGYVRYRAD